MINKDHLKCILKYCIESKYPVILKTEEKKYLLELMKND